MFSKEESKDIKKILKSYIPLSKKVAAHYISVGKSIGLDKKKLEEASFSGAIYGYVVHSRKKSEKGRVKYKLSAYLTWWMRRFIHKEIAKRIIEIGKKNPAKAENILLEFLEG